MAETQTRDEKIAALKAMAEGSVATAPVTTTAPAATTTEVPATTTAQDAATVAPAETPAAPAEDKVSFDRATLKRKIKWLDEHIDVDLAELLEKSPEQIDEAFRKAKDRDRQEQKRRDAEEKLAADVPAAVTARDKQYDDVLRANGLRLDRTTGKVVPLQPTAPSASAGQPDLDALEKAAMAENSPEAWGAYLRAVRAASNSLDGGTLDQRLDAKLQEHQRKLAESERQAREQEALVKAFADKVEATIKSLDAKFAKAGDLKDHWIQVARERAQAHVAQQGTKATEQSILQVFHDTADLVDRSVATAQRALSASAASRPKAPTVLPSGGAPGPATTDPTKIDGTTPEGRQKRIDLLRQQAEARRATSAA